MSLFSSGDSVDFRARGDEGQEGYLVFSHDGIDFHADFTNKASYSFAADTVVDVSVDAQGQESERYTFTRLFFFKLYALAFPKRSYREQVEVVVALSDGTEAVFDLTNTGSDEAWAKISPFLEFYTGQMADDESIAGELERLDALRQSGSLSDEEFAQAKERIIGGKA